jgi:hypothetical protein
MTTRLFLLALGAVVLAPAVAAAQPGGYYGQPQVSETGHHLRAGMPLLGFGIGLGGLKIDDKNLDCPSCAYDPIGVGVDFHVGGMLSDRFGLMLELQANAETVEEDRYGTTSLVQYAAMIAGQYWVTPQLWVKGGIGLTHLAYEYDDYYYQGTSQPVDAGGALMAAIGYEVFSSPTFALDLQGRFITAGYDGIERTVTAATIGLGFSWYGFGRGGVLIIH